MTVTGDAGLTFTNPKIQRLRRLLGRRSRRWEEAALVVEGPVLVAEAVAAGWQLEAQFVATGVEPIAGAGTVHRLAHGVADRLSTLDSPSGIFAVATLDAPSVSVLAAAATVLVADGVAEPGNLGTIMRSAEAAGFDAVVTTPGTVDWTSPKVVRASAGAVFHVPVVAATLAEVAAAGLECIGTSSHRGEPSDVVVWPSRVAVVVGNEAAGLADDAAVSGWVTVPHAGRAESLNVAMASTVVAFDVARARRRSSS